MGSAVTTAGSSNLASRISNADTTTPLHLAWGTAFSDPSPLDTGLDSEDTTPGYARVVATITYLDGVYLVKGTIAAQDDLTIKEWGIFTVGGALVFRQANSSGWTVVDGEGQLVLAIRATLADNGMLTVRSSVGGVLKLDKATDWPYYCLPTDLSCVPTAAVAMDTAPSAVVECA